MIHVSAAKETRMCGVDQGAHRKASRSALIEIHMQVSNALSFFPFLPFIPLAILTLWIHTKLDSALGGWAEDTCSILALLRS